jgi:hypothetical protein
MSHFQIDCLELAHCIEGKFQEEMMVGIEKAAGLVY